MLFVIAFIFIILAILAYSTRSLLYGFIGTIPFLIISFFANEPLDPYIWQPVWVFYNFIAVALALGFVKTFFPRRFVPDPEAVNAVNPAPASDHARKVQLSGSILLGLLFSFLTTIFGYYPLFIFLERSHIIRGSDSLLSIMADFITGLFIAYSLFGPYWFAFFTKKFKAAVIASIPSFLFSVPGIGGEDGWVYFVVSVTGLLLAFVMLSAISKPFRQVVREKFNYFKSIKITVSAGQKK